MITVGEKLRKTRISIGLSQRKMAAGVINTSFYSRVEHDINTISATSLIKLLAKHDLSVIKFMQDFGNVAPHNLFYERKISSAFLKQDADELKRIKADSNLNNQLTRDVIDLILDRLGAEHHVDLNKLKMRLKHTILQIDEWDASYLWLFLNVMDLYSFNDLGSLIGSIFNHYKNRHNYNATALKILAGIAVKYLFICQGHKQAKGEIKKSLDLLEELPAYPEIFVEKLFGQYFKAKLNNNQELLNQVSIFLEKGNYEYYFEQLS